MTIIVGLICKDGIVLASDSQTTTGSSKRCDAKKFALVEFDNARVLVAQAGNVCTSSRAIEIFQILAKGQKLLDRRTVADIAQKAMRQVKDELRLQQCDCSMEELRDFIWRNEIGCELMIAHYFKGKPYIYRIDLVIGIANRIRSHSAAIGCGSNLGEYLLSEHSKPEMGSEFGSAVAVYVVETVKKHDAFCGGPTRIGRILSNEGENTVDILSKEDVADIAKAIADIDETTKQERNEKINESLQSLADLRIKKFLEQFSK